MCKAMNGEVTNHFGIMILLVKLWIVLCVDHESLCASLGFFNQFNYPNHLVGFQVRFIMIQFEKLKKDNLFAYAYQLEIKIKQQPA